MDLFGIAIRIEHIPQHFPSFRQPLPNHEVFAHADDLVVDVKLLVGALLGDIVSGVTVPVSCRENDITHTCAVGGLVKQEQPLFTAEGWGIGRQDASFGGI